MTQSPTLRSPKPAVTPRVFAIVGVAIAFAGVAGTAVVRSLAPVPLVGAFGFDQATQVGYLVEGVTWASIGALLVIRRPGNVVGWFMVAIGVGYSLSQASVALTFALAADGTVDRRYLAQLAGWVTVLLQLVAILQVAIGFLFPTGLVQSPAWGRFMRLFWCFAAVFVVLGLFQSGPLQLIPGIENPFGFIPDLRGGQPIAPFLVFLTLWVLVGLMLSLGLRYRAADRVERQQLKWFVLALSVSAVGLGFAVIESTLPGRPSSATGLTIFVFAGAAVPVAIGIAILRYRLYAIDRIVSRTIAYGVVISVLAILSYVIVFVLSSVLVSFAQGEAIAVAASTLVVFAAFQAMARPVRQRVDRRFNRAHYDAEQTALAFSIRLRDEVDLETVTTDLGMTVQQAVDPAASGLWLRPTSRTLARTTNP
jgi:hypothetical protein